VTQRDVGIPKPSPEYIYQIQAQTGVELREIAYIGDKDKTDSFCAINAGVLPFAAHYSNETMKYGLPVLEPKALADYLHSFGLQDAPFFGWTFDGRCDNTGKDIFVHALFGAHKDLGLTQYLIDFLKDKNEVFIGRRKTPLGGILFHYLVSQSYLSGLIQDIDCVTVFPGHKANSVNPILDEYSGIVRKTFRQSYMPNLLIRHTDAPDSRRTAGADREVFEQFRTILVNPSFERQVRDKNILVLDDFTTSGCSFETARHMLLNAGANNVVGLAVAKWGNSYAQTRVTKDWNPFEPCPLQRTDFVSTRITRSLNRQADVYFQKVIWPVYSA
jgi:hypothetical protein